MEDDQQFCLRWNNHQTTLIQNFDTLLESGTLVDCTLAAEGKYLKAHKVVLSACSPYFEGLLSEHYDKHPVFILKDVKFKELKAMMDYMYRGEVNISQDQLAALLKAAESLQIKGLSESRTGGNGCTKPDTRQSKVSSQSTAPSLDIPHASSGLTIEKNSKVPRQSLAQSSVGDLPEDSASPSIPKGISSREGSQSPVSRKRKRLRRRSVGEDNSIENHESNSSDMTQQPVPALGVAPVADEKSHADAADSLGRSALMQQLTKPADEMLQLPVEKPEPTEDMIQPKSEYLDDPEESVEDLTLDDDMNDLNEMEDSNRAGPSSHDPNQHPGLAAWHVTGDRSNAGGVVGSVAGGPGAQDEVFLAAHEAVQAQRDSQGYGQYMFVGEGAQAEVVWESINISDENMEGIVNNCNEVKQTERSERKTRKFEPPAKQGQVKYLTRSRFRMSERSTKNKTIFDCPNNCGNSFFQKLTLDRHLKFTCGQPLRYRCPYCNMSSRIRNCINIHLKARHPGLRNYVIDTTSKPETEFEEDYNSPHIVQKVEPIWNEEQEIKILNVSSLAALDIKHEYDNLEDEDDNFFNKHLVRAHKRYVCPNNCGNSYKHEHTLKVHLKFGCNRNDQHNFHLDDDESDSEYDVSTNDVLKVKSTNELLNPMAITELKNYEQNSEGRWICPNQCGGTFSSRGNLNYHLKTNCGIKAKLECPYCLHRSKQPSNGFVHVRNSHPGAEICLVHVDTGEVFKSKKEADQNPNLDLINGSPQLYVDRKKPSGKAANNCQNCGKDFKSERTLARHILEGCGYPPRFKCPYCDYQVRRLSYAFFHVSKHHPGCEVYMVDLVTGDSITDPAQIKKEAIADIADEPKPLPIDPVLVLRPQRIVKSHPAGLQKKRLLCPMGCGRFFFFRASLEKHKKYYCSQNRTSKIAISSSRYKCPYCENRYEHISSLFRHIKSTHPTKKKHFIDTHEEEIVPESANSPIPPKKEPPPKAKKLPKQSEDLDEKTDDNLETKEPPKVFVCPNKCGSSFANLCNVQRHIRLNCSKARRYKCPQCNYRSQKFLQIAKHVKANHKTSKIYAVDFFTKKQIFGEQRHRPTRRIVPPKTEETPTIEVKPVVKRRDPQPKADNKTGKKRFPCTNNCGRSFSTKRAVTMHFRHICGKAPRFKCPYCTQICRHQGNMTIHIKHRHPGKKNYMIDISKKKKSPTENKKEEKQERGEIKEEKEIKQEKVIKGTVVKETVIKEEKERKENVDDKTKTTSIFGNSTKRKIPRLFNYKRRRLMCPNNCGRFFTSRVKLKLHTSTVCKNPVNTKCPYCPKVGKYAWNIDRHIKQHHSDVDRKQILQEQQDSKNEKIEDEQEEEVELKLTDNIEEDSPQDLENLPKPEEADDIEMKMVNEPENAEEKVDIPDTPSSTNSSSTALDSPSKKFVCPNNCGKSYPKESSLKNHLFFTCQKPARYACPYCRSCSKVTSNGYVHVKRMHPDRKVYLIDITTNKVIRSRRMAPDRSRSYDMDREDDREYEKEDGRESEKEDDREYEKEDDREYEKEDDREYEKEDDKEDEREDDREDDKEDKDDVDMEEEMALSTNVDIDVDEPDEPDEPILGADEEFTNDPISSERESLEMKQKEEVFVCPNNCGSSFTHENKLNNHVRDQCGPPRFKCPYCFYITREPSNVYAHIKNKHPDERIYMIDTDMNQSCNEPDSPTGNEDN
ncbi:zinc finger protein Xfin-like [Leptopilina heterotoma]|uniref:zinc finger protein Xfin-like n=1 Tax=Leptopilina heterotoma TaxID=63436 RepID=UPI001CA97A75|nr:zinc finger protein Xfin-like [Leptopilina heterotoma]XP_043465624.1 zinc finger protein Xfin-like [Leptopilina heterotoma]